MTRFAALLIAALATSGCFISDSGSDSQPLGGSVNLYWDFLRYAPAAPGAAQDGFILYDADLVGSGNSSCPESGVQTVDVSSPLGTLNFPCTFSGVQGVTLDNLPAGNVTLRVKGWRNDGADRVLWDGTVQVNVISGRTVDVYLDVDPVSADIDVVGYFSYAPSKFYATCNEAQNPNVTYRLYDSLGTLVLTSTVGCPTGASAFPLTVVQSTLDLDTYTMRLQGFTGGSQVRTFDACQVDSASDLAKRVSFGHYAASTGAAEIDVDLFTPPKCAP